MDPQFTTHLAIAQVWASTAFLLAETPVLPINCSDYATALNNGVLGIQKKFGSILEQRGISLGKWSVISLSVEWAAKTRKSLELDSNT